MAKLEKNGIQRQIATLGDELPSDAVEDYFGNNGGEGDNPPLPDNIVIDPDYVHTDNNYDNDAVSKLAGLQNYDDAALNAAITSETARATAAEDALQSSKADDADVFDWKVTDVAITFVDGAIYNCGVYNFGTLANTQGLTLFCQAWAANNDYDWTSVMPSGVSVFNADENIWYLFDGTTWNGIQPPYQNTYISVTWFYKGTRNRSTYTTALPIADGTKSGQFAPQDWQKLNQVASDIAAALNAANQYTDEQIASQLTGDAQYWKPAVETVGDLPAITGTDQSKTWLCRVRSTNNVYQCIAFTGDYTADNWVLYSENTDYVDEDELDNALAGLETRLQIVSSTVAGQIFVEQDKTLSVYGWGALVADVTNLATQLLLHTGNATVHITSAERTAWNEIGTLQDEVLGSRTALNSLLTNLGLETI